jgi:hypothetical protein
LRIIQKLLVVIVLDRIMYVILGSIYCRMALVRAKISFISIKLKNLLLKNSVLKGLSIFILVMLSYKIMNVLVISSLGISISFIVRI